MIFVFKYKRESGESITLGIFDDSQMAIAQQLRYDAEIAAIDDNPKPEIVVLSAATEADLRKTHAKYFGEDAIRASISRTRA